MLFSSNNMQETCVYNSKCSPNEILNFYISTRRPVDRATHTYIYLHCVQYFMHQHRFSSHQQGQILFAYVLGWKFVVLHGLVTTIKLTLAL